MSAFIPSFKRRRGSLNHLLPPALLAVLLLALITAVSYRSSQRFTEDEPTTRPSSGGWTIWSRSSKPV